MRMQQSPQTQCPYEIYHAHCYNLVTTVFFGVSLEKLLLLHDPHKGYSLILHLGNFQGSPCIIT
jgi:hypothetical protein